MTALIEAYDAALFDLDGVVYLGPDAVPAAPATIAALRARGTTVGFVTNNAARSPETVARHLTSIGVAADAADVVTSAQAVARVMAEAMPARSRVLVVGSEALADEIAAVGLEPYSGSGVPAAVVVGFCEAITWRDLNEACFAVQRGARWYGCNSDRTRPTDRGLAIGLGAMLSAMGEALPGHEPVLAGKPARPLLAETIRRLGARHPLFIGDRLDTDIEGAQASGIDSLFVLSGSHGKTDLVVAPKNQRPTYIGLDLSALLDEPVTGVSGSSTATVRGQLERLWVIARECWAAADRGEVPDRSELDQLTLLP